MKRSRHLLLSLILACLAWLPTTAPAASEIAIFEIHHRPAADLVAPLKSMLGDEASVATDGSRLIVRTTPERLAAVRRWIRDLDHAPRNVIVEVQTHRARQQQRAAVDIDGYGIQAQGRARTAHTRRRGEGIQRVRTVDGRPALIRIGRSIPVYQVERWRDGPYTGERMHLQYKEITTGILVLPQLHGDRVTVEVYQQDERQAVRTGEFATQDAASVVTGRLGEWLPMGSIATTASGRRHGIGLRASTHAEDELEISVRVLPVTTE